MLSRHDRYVETPKGVRQYQSVLEVEEGKGQTDRLRKGHGKEELYTSTLMAIHLLPALFTGLLFPYIPNIFMIWGFVGFSTSAYMTSLVLRRILGEKAEE